MRDYTEVPPAQMQALAARYLAPAKAWRLEILPRGLDRQPVTAAAR